MLRQSVAEVVRKQAEVGIDIPSDGEFGKRSWATYILDRVSGFEIRADRLQPLVWLGRDRERFPEFFAKEMPNALTGAPTEVCVGPITYHGAARHAARHRQLPGALAEAGRRGGVLAGRRPGQHGLQRHQRVLPERRGVRLRHRRRAAATEYQAIVDAGLLVQVDDAVLANMYDHLVQTSPEHYRKWAQLRVDALNHALEGIPEDRVRYHVCFGSWHVPHVADAPLEALVDLILQVPRRRLLDRGRQPAPRARVARLGERQAAGGRSPDSRRHHPPRHDRRAPAPGGRPHRPLRRLVGRENVIAGTDCGFAQSQGTQRVHPTVMWAKFAALVEGARLASSELW